MNAKTSRMNKYRENAQQAKRPPTTGPFAASRATGQTSAAAPPSPTPQRRPAPPYPKRGASALAALALALLALAFTCLCAPQSALAASEGTAATTTRVIYHFVDGIEDADVATWGDYEPARSVFFYAPQSAEEDEVTVCANPHPDTLTVSTGALRWRVVENYASNSLFDAGEPVDVTDRASYDGQTGTVSLPAEFAGRDITVVFYVDASCANAEVPVNVQVTKTIDGQTTEATVSASLLTAAPTIDLTLFADETDATRATSVSVVQAGTPIEQFTYAHGSISIVASPLAGDLSITVSDGTQASTPSPDGEVSLNEELISLLSADNPYVGERFDIPKDGALIRTTGKYSNMGEVLGWPDKNRYGFLVHFTSCENADVLNADADHVAPGGWLNKEDNDGNTDYTWATGTHWAWAECAGDVDNNRAGEPSVKSGYVEVTAIDYATGTVTYAFHLECYSTRGGYHDQQTIEGTFQVHEDLGGWISLQKTSGLESITDDNGCYTLAGAQYTVYSDAACTTAAATLTTDDQGKAASERIAQGTYYVKETVAPQGYALDETTYSVTVSGGLTAQVNAEAGTVIDLPQSGTGSILLAKMDAEHTWDDDVNLPLGSATLAGAEFTVKYYDSLEADATEGESKRTWVFETDDAGRIDLKQASEHFVSGDSLYANSAGEVCLPLGTYTIQETKAPMGYLADNTVHTRTVTASGTAEDAGAFNALTGDNAIQEQVKRGDIEFTKRDQSNTEVLAHVAFRITAKSSGESHVVLTDENGYYSTSASYNKHTVDANGNDDAYDFDTQDVIDGNYNAEAGLWFGMDAAGTTTEPNDALGALPYDTYTIEELPCTANEGKALVDPIEVIISRDSYTVNIGTIDDPTPLIATTAADERDGDKTVLVDTDAAIVDTVQYSNVPIGRTGTLKASIVDKDSLNEVVATAQTEFTSEGNGVVNVEIPVNLSGRGEHTLAVVEELWLDGRKTASHNEGLDEAEQEVKAIQPAIGTEALDEADGDHLVLAGENVGVIDTVSFDNLIEGEGYTALGMLMDAETLLPLVFGEGEYDQAELEEFTAELMKALGAQWTSSEDEDTLGEIGEALGIAEEDGGQLAFDLDNEVDIDELRQICDDHHDLACRLAYTTREVKPDTASGTFEMAFSMNCVELAGKESVCFEAIVCDGHIIASHCDISDEGQTVQIYDEETPPVELVKTSDSWTAIALAISVFAVAAGIVALACRRRQHTLR